MNKTSFFTNITEDFSKIKYVQCKVAKDPENKHVRKKAFNALFENKNYMSIFIEFWQYYILGFTLILVSFLFSIYHLGIFLGLLIAVSSLALHRVNIPILYKLFLFPSISFIFIQYKMIELSAGGKSEDEGSFIFGKLQKDPSNKEYFSAYKISQFDFILKRYRYYLLLLILLSFLFFMNSPITAIVGFYLYYITAYKFTIYSSVSKISKAFKGIVFFMIFGAISGLIVLFYYGASYQAKDFIQSIFYLVLIIFLSHIMLGLFSKYKEVYAIGAKNIYDSKEAKYYIWLDEYGEMDSIYK